MAAILFSIVGVLVIGEILPQAVCTGPHQIKIAELCCPVVLGLMYITAPITWPIAKGLDLWMGEHKLRRFNNAELKEIIKLHRKKELALVHSEMPEGVTGLDNTQANIMTGAMTIGEVPIFDIYTPIERVVKIYLDTKFNAETTNMLVKAGFSRVPVAYSESNPIIIGILLVKNILAVEVQEETITNLYNRGEIQLKVPSYLS